MENLSFSPTFGLFMWFFLNHGKISPTPFLVRRQGHTRMPRMPLAVRPWIWPRLRPRTRRSIKWWNNAICLVSPLCCPSIPKTAEPFGDYWSRGRDVTNTTAIAFRRDFRIQQLLETDTVREIVWQIHAATIRLSLSRRWEYGLYDSITD